jgi:glutamyl-tRNA reductase
VEFAVIGLNHQTASADVREKAAFSDMKKLEIINELLDKGIEEVVILSTCNRSEMYIAGNEKNLDRYIEVVKSYYMKILHTEEEKHLYIKQGEEAIYHLYYVASGLDSIVIGEDQILGQVKDAHSLAMSVGSSKKILNKIFREAVSTAKNIKATLKISEQAMSISYIGVKFLKEKIENIRDKSVLIVGIGKMGRLSLKYMIEEVSGKIYVAYRNRQKILDILEEYPQVIAVDYKDRYKALQQVDILITATASPHVVFKLEDMQQLNKELYIMDMAIPRDVEASVGNVDNIHLYNVDNLKSISSLNEKRREQLSEEAKEIIKSDIEVLKVWFSTLNVDPIIKSLKEKCEVIQQDTLDYLNRKLDLDNRDKKIIEKMLNSSLKRLIREPILRLKEMEDYEKRKQYAKVLEELFECIP